MNANHSSLATLLTELREQTQSFRIRCKTVGWLGALFHIRIQEDVLADVASAQTQLGDVAHKAESFDREALRLMDEAQAPDSDGGEMITVSEAKKIRTFTLKSAELDHEVSDLATV